MGASPWLTPRRRRSLAAEVEEELQLHLALRATENERDGMAPEDALADAHTRFGNIDAIHAACLDAEDDHPLRLASRAALRVGVLGVGFGAIALAFALVQAVLLQPLRFHEADRLIRFGEGWDDARIQASTFIEWRDASTSFEAFTALDATECVLTGNGLPLRVRAMRIGDGYFDVFGVAPLLGRTFQPDEVEATPQPVVLLSEALWESRYRRSPTILGRSIPLDGQPHTVVGVMPPQAQLSHRVDLWTPLPLDPVHASPVYAVGRMRPGVELQDVRADLAVLTDALAIPDAAAQRTQFHPLRDLYTSPIRPTILLLVVVGGLLLVLAWTSVVRGSFDRSPLGRAQPVASSRQTWGEALAVAGGAAVLGGALAVGAYRLTYEALFERWGGLFAPPGGAVIGAVAGLALATAIGLVAAQRLAGGRALRRWAEQVLVVGATAAMVVLVGVVAEQHRSVWSAPVPDPGLDPQDLYVSNVTLPGSLEREAMRERMAGVLDRVRAVPGVEAASLGWAFPFVTEERLIPQTVHLDPHTSDRQLDATVDLVETGFSATLRAPLLEGRTARALPEEALVREAVVSATFAAQAWPGQSALGRRIDIGGDGLVRTVVGVMNDLNYAEVEPDVPVVFVPFAEYAMPQMALVVRGAVAGGTEVRRAVFAADSEVAIQPFVAVADLQAGVDPSTRARLILLSVLTLLGLASVVFAIVQTGMDRARTRGRRGEPLTRHQPGLLAVGLGLVLGVGLAVLATHELAWLGDLDRSTVVVAAVGTGLVLAVTNWVVSRQGARSG